MKTIFKIQVTFLLAICLGSCSSAQLISNKSPEFNDTSSRIYIVLGGDRDASYFMKSLRYYLHTDLKESGVTSKVYIPNALALNNENTYKEEIRNFKPDLVLFIEATKVASKQQYNQYPNTSTSNQSYAEFELELSKPSETDLIWKSIMSVSGNLLSMPPAKKASKAILKQFIEDGIII